MILVFHASNSMLGPGGLLHAPRCIKGRQKVMPKEINILIGCVDSCERAKKRFDQNAESSGRTMPYGRLPWKGVYVLLVSKK